MLATITALADRFCRGQLNEEYAAQCRKLTWKLARKRPSPLPSGKPQVWACAIARVIGWANCLDDRFEFDERGGGEFHVGYVPGRMDGRLTTRDGGSRRHGGRGWRP